MVRKTKKRGEGPEQCDDIKQSGGRCGFELAYDGEEKNGKEFIKMKGSNGKRGKKTLQVGKTDKGKQSPMESHH